ncbi:hypothetical protein BDB00DRAFT_26912 [Zychaea mexicana]|uniref:uncharacterized protein n=1 Tax=Zychaea mexicana TaxID=64656 RepID=UPI0022FDC369|nr:uncharacterized protein BDB00DRAFT_320191 [Zychaea mexicana]XP_052975050.1 uncharacterized protein BDB00DRAFT_26912 [Zychaea mexicana]KAI9466521.1 hypothetical protein BDB00DRAFT_320191 [Zychaea mexicana]KAI9488785.1 hypothetical protein BDB00DRAFT_26912 [Zychaea mexicana]
MSTTVLGIIREQRAVSVSDALTKMAANLLEDWTTSDVDDAYRFTLSLSLSLIVDVANNNTSKKMLKALEPSHVHEVKEHSKSQSNTIKELPAFLSLIFKETIELLELEGEHPALRYLSNAASKQLETEKDNINLQVIDILTYVIRNVKKWGNEKGATEVDWTHRLVSLLDILLRDTDLSVRIMATKVVRQANEHAFGDKEKISSIVGRKIDVIMEHDEFELSASEWKSAGAGDSLVDKQHNKNLRVNACVLLQILRLPFDGFNNDISILSMEWTGAEGKLVSMKRYNNYFVGTTIGDMYLPLTLDDISDFHKTLTLLLHWKNEHLKLRKVVRGPLLRQRRFERSRSNYTSSIATSANTNPDIFFTPTQDRSSN